MQDFERERHAQAYAAFQKAFDEGYAQGTTKLAAGAERLDDVKPNQAIPVSRDNLDDGQYGGHTVRFKRAGQRAALAKNRTGEATLDASQADVNNSNANTMHELVWWVRF